MSVIQVTVAQIQSVSEFVYKVILTSEEALPEFNAGQYLQVVMSAEDKRPFSIANPPYEKSFLELHIGASEHNPYAMQVIERMQKEGKIEVELPCGNAVIQDDAENSILIAGGTGYSYTRSLLLQKLHANKGAKVSLYWGAKTPADLYEMNYLQELAQQHSDFVFVPVIEHAQPDWNGRTGLVHKAVLEDFDSLDEQHVYVAGRFEMAKVVRDEFLPKGIKAEQLIGDAFAYID
ncbi:NAD(P)H-flavin reductase [Planctobacterium marinum]|uniref:NAD(P)H-flavin reductase n=1 Tax=Planctobacterium marinum TaxID=1631968 RepID=A0AA48HKZ8_9ALTE|nr:NAD(P)H-flavin reductase [Planctobacterium marinum]